MKEPNKVFLTGASGTGKTQIVNHCIGLWQGPVAGLCSCKRDKGTSGQEVVFWDLQDPETLYTAARFFPDGKKQFYPEMFETAGTAILNAVVPQPGLLLVIDELGYIENDAPLYQIAVERVLRLQIPVLAVLRQSSTPFLDRLRAGNPAEELVLTKETRQDILKVCKQKLGI